MAKLTNEEKERRANRAKTLAGIAKKAHENGFRPAMGHNIRGYWVALRTWCAKHDVAYPMAKRGRKPGKATKKRAKGRR